VESSDLLDYKHSNMGDRSFLGEQKIMKTVPLNQLKKIGKRELVKAG
jgi:hypothetical protein